MPRFRICKIFTVESGHMLSKHPERCRYPHGHTRRIEVVVSSERLDSNDMVVDFKALKLAIGGYIGRYDHAMAINSMDPLLPEIRRVHPESAIVFEGVDPTTEVLAKDLYDHVCGILEEGYEEDRGQKASYRIPAGLLKLERLRVWETPESWAEFGE